MTMDMERNTVEYLDLALKTGVVTYKSASRALKKTATECKSLLSTYWAGNKERVDASFLVSGTRREQLSVLFIESEEAAEAAIGEFDKISAVHVYSLTQKGNVIGEAQTAAVDLTPVDVASLGELHKFGLIKGPTERYTPETSQEKPVAQTEAKPELKRLETVKKSVSDTVSKSAGAKAELPLGAKNTPTEDKPKFVYVSRKAKAAEPPASRAQPTANEVPKEERPKTMAPAESKLPHLGKRPSENKESVDSDGYITVKRGKVTKKQTTLASFFNQKGKK